MQTYRDNKAKVVSKVFEDVFKNYDIMNDLMSLGVHRLWKKSFIEWLNPYKNTKLVDVASGTGDIAKLYLEKVGYSGNVWCVDENKGMLNISKKKLGQINNIKWHCGKAEKLPFKDNEFDYYTISFGIRNVNNVNIVLDEAFRVLKPGGKFMCLEFSKVKIDILNKLYQIYSKSIPKIGKFVLGKSEPYEYLVKSIREFYSQEELLELMEKSNFVNLSYKNLSGGIVAIHSGWKI